MKNILFIHGYNGVPKVFQWASGELKKKGYRVILPEFPPREGVQYNIWSAMLDEYEKEITEDTIVIAHSIGNACSIHYLAQRHKKIKGFISLAGFVDVFEHEGREDLNRAVREFLVQKEEIEVFQQLVDEKFAIYSDNDHIVPFEVLEDYVKKLDAHPIFIQGIGHMGSKSGVEEIPELLEVVNKIEKGE